MLLTAVPPVVKQPGQSQLCRWEKRNEPEADRNYCITLWCCVISANKPMLQGSSCIFVAYLFIYYNFSIINTTVYYFYYFYLLLLLLFMTYLLLSYFLLTLLYTTYLLLVIFIYCTLFLCIVNVLFSFFFNFPREIYKVLWPILPHLIHYIRCNKGVTLLHTDLSRPETDTKNPNRP